MSPFLSSTGPTASLSSNLASNKTSSVNQLINRSSNCCGRSLIRPVLSAVWVAASPQCLPLVYITIHFVRSCLLYKGDHGGAYAVEWADLRGRPPSQSRLTPCQLPQGGSQDRPRLSLRGAKRRGDPFCAKRSKPSHIGSPEQAALSLYKWVQVRSDGAPDGTPPPLENGSKVGQKLWKTRWKVEEN